MHSISSSAIILDTVVKSTLLLAIAWGAALILKKRSAATQHMVRAFALGRSAAASDLCDGVARVAYKRNSAISQEPACNAANGCADRTFTFDNSAAQGGNNILAAHRSFCRDRAYECSSQARPSSRCEVIRYSAVRVS